MSWDADILCIGDRDMLESRAQRLGMDVEFLLYTTGTPPLHTNRSACYIHVPAPAEVIPGKLDPANAYYVLALLSLATELCATGEAHGLVTGPVQNLSSTTRAFLHRAHRIPGPRLWLPASGDDVGCRRISGCLATTHLPLSEVSDAITRQHLTETLNILHSNLDRHFGLAAPRITVLGLNPHAGEGGHLGREEIEFLSPVINELREQGLNLTEPLPADTAFTPHWRAATDAYLAMYHDQGLPVLKSAGFGEQSI